MTTMLFYFYSSSESPTTLRVDLAEICDGVDPTFFYPIVYRLDLDTIDPNRRKKAGSGITGSAEYLIEDLQETEFDILFLDYNGDPDFVALATSAVDAQAALTILKNRC